MLTEERLELAGRTTSKLADYVSEILRSGFRSRIAAAVVSSKISSQSAKAAAPDSCR